MTVKQMRLLLKGLPGDMPVMIDTGEAGLISVCGENSQVIELKLLEFEDMDDEDFKDDDPINDFHEYDLDEDDETIEVLVLIPCNHVEEIEEGEINSQPELN